MSKIPPPAKGNVLSHGCDGPVVGRDGDHLNRWPFAREIYGIATTGPNDWSVRVGVYGEWGTGKTSVLKFVASMAEPAGHIVIWFDPWQHSTKAELWRAFVLTVFNQLESKLGDVPGADQARRKVWMEKAKGVVGAVTGLVNDSAGKAVDAGLELVKKHFAFSQADLSSLQAILGDKRVIVLIDDLDRTAPELVPEILFALKELMNIPGFSFICAFDPVVVGQVLGTFHPGFGDGLKFLDKIIDYPRWLSLPTPEALAKLAIADAKHSCPFVPESVISDAVQLLPANPRAVRQFIRILALLKPQIDRHHDRELHWPAIIAANILKVRHPRLAHELLNTSGFWNSVGFIGLSLRGEDEGVKTAEAVDEHIAKVCASLGVEPEPSQRSEIKRAMLALCSKVNLFGGLSGDSVSYQFNVGEAPAAVTWKEFDAFLPLWRANPTAGTIQRWISRHASQVERFELEVYRELLNAAVRRYAEVLHKADNAFSDREKAPLIDEASSFLSLLEIFVFDMGRLDDKDKQIGPAELELMVDKFASFANAGLAVHTQFWPRNEAFILKLVERWSPDILPVIQLLQPYAGIRLRNFDGKGSAELHKKLCAVALPRFAGQLIERFREGGFVSKLMARDDNSYDSRCALLDASGPVWKTLRSDVFAILKEAPSDSAVQENAYELLHWLVLARAGHAPDIDAIKTLFSDQLVFDAVWNAATTSQLGPRAVAYIRELPVVMKQLGINCPLPSWWAPIVATFTIPAPPQPPDESAITDLPAEVEPPST